MGIDRFGIVIDMKFIDIRVMGLIIDFYHVYKVVPHS